MESSACRFGPMAGCPGLWGRGLGFAGAGAGCQAERPPAPDDGRRHEHGGRPQLASRTTKDQGCTRASPSSRLSLRPGTVMIDPKDLVVDFRSYFLDG